MIYEIVNPSDACTIEADSDVVAGIAILMLGEGSYGTRREDGKSLPTLCLFGGSVKGCLDDLGVGGTGEPNERVTQYLDAHAPEVAAALESLVYAGVGTRKAMLAALDGLPDKQERLFRLNDERRSSLNDINRRAQQLASWLRKKGQ